MLVQCRLKWVRRYVLGGPATTLEPRLKIFDRDSLALTSCGRDGVVPLLQCGGRGTDQIFVEEDGARLQMRTNLAVDLADALEVAQVVEAARRDGGRERGGLFRQPIHCEEVGTMRCEKLAIRRGEASCAIQHWLGPIVRNARRVRIPVEDEPAQRPVTRTDIQDGDCGVLGKGKEVAHQLKPLGPTRIFSLFLPHPLFYIG